MNELLIAANGFISLCYFTIALLIFVPFIRGQQKTPLVLATILVFFSCGLGHGGHVMLMTIENVHSGSSALMKFQVGVDLVTAAIAITYIALRGSFGFLVDAPLLLTQAQTQLADANEQLAQLNATLEIQVADRTAELAAANEQLVSSEARFKQLAANVPGMIYQFCLESDGKMRFPYVSSGCLALYELEPEAIQQNAALLVGAIYPDDREAFERSLAQSIQTLNTWEWQGRIVTVSEQVKWIQGISRPQKRADGAIIWNGLLIDISERKEAEAALQVSQSLLAQKADRLEAALNELQQTQSQLIQSEKMSSLGQLVAGIAHEINNPVNFIHGNLSYAIEYVNDLLQVLDEYQYHYPSPPLALQETIEATDLAFLRSDLPNLVTSMQMGTERIRDIVLSLRTFSRLDEAERKAVDLHDGLESTLLILKHRLKKARVEIQVVKQYGELPLVECYAGQLNQVFMNVLSNAIDALEEHCPAETPTIRIWTEQLTPNRVVVRISDNGMGIPEEVQSRMFDPFFTTKPIGQGTGLGLSISYQVVVDRHGGLFKCSSEPGQGTEFWIEIPVQPEEFAS